MTERMDHFVLSHNNIERTRERERESSKNTNTENTQQNFEREREREKGSGKEEGRKSKYSQQGYHFANKSHTDWRSQLEKSEFVGARKFGSYRWSSRMFQLESTHSEHLCGTAAIHRNRSPRLRGIGEPD